jgi:predicted RNase H-like HicB family nuclease
MVVCLYRSPNFPYRSPNFSFVAGAGAVICRMNHYIVIIEHQDLPSGRLYGAFVPDVPGCTVTGATFEQTLDRVQHTLAATFRRMRSRGECLPEPHSYEEHEQQFRSAGEAFGDAVVAAIPLPEEAATAYETVYKTVYETAYKTAYGEVRV